MESHKSLDLNTKTKDKSKIKDLCKYAIIIQKYYRDKKKKEYEKLYHKKDKSLVENKKYEDIQAKNMNLIEFDNLIVDDFDQNLNYMVNASKIIQNYFRKKKLPLYYLSYKYKRIGYYEGKNYINLSKTNPFLFL